MGTQKAIALQIVAQGGDYVLALKGNQGNLCYDGWDSYGSSIVYSIRLLFFERKI